MRPSFTQQGDGVSAGQVIPGPFGRFGKGLSRAGPIATRSVASVDMATRQPSPGAPSTQSSGTNTLSRKTSLNMVRPVISRSGRMSMPGACMSTRKYVIPWCFRAGSVRARQMAQSAWRARDVHTFWPLSSQPPPTSPSPFSAGRALVRSDARSEPASGSLNSWHQVISARLVGPRKRSRWAWLPYFSIAGPAQAPIPG